MKRTIIAIAVFLVYNNSANAQWAPGINPGQTVTSDNVGIGQTNPTANLQIDNANYRQDPFMSGSLTTIPPIPALRINNDYWVGDYTSPAPSNVVEISHTTTYGPGSTSAPIPYFYIDGGGEVGIGTATPTKALDVVGDIAGSGDASIGGNLRVGPMQAINSYAGYRLSVDGDIICRKEVVQITDWADYVFNANYELRTIPQLDNYIQANHHLPDIPTSAEVSNSGVDLGANQVKLLQKVEELTLYIIQLQKQIDDMKKQN
ncbi:MAG: hypothetical protein ABI378_08400 [Chitinophagaceae bacterium]